MRGSPPGYSTSRPGFTRLFLDTHLRHLAQRSPPLDNPTQPLPPPDANPVSCIQSGNPESETSARLALPDSTSQIGHLVSGLTANSVGSATLSRVRRRFSPDRFAKHSGCHHRPMPRNHYGLGSPPRCTGPGSPPRCVGHGSLGHNLHPLAVSPTKTWNPSPTFPKSKPSPSPDHRKSKPSENLNRNHQPPPIHQPSIPPARPQRHRRK